MVSWRLIWWCVALVALLGCDGKSAAVTNGQPSVAVETVATQVPPVRATDRDDEALDEALSDALLELQNKFKCNRISGCAVQGRIVDFGWRATKHVMSQYARTRRRAAWRGRLVLIVAELRDPMALPFLFRAAHDGDDEVVAFALYGLALLDHKDSMKVAVRWADAGDGMLFQMSRLSARWALARWGHIGAADSFKEELASRSRQMLASATVAWGLRLCAEAPALDCAEERRTSARHPGFLARREVVTRLAARPVKAEIGTLVMLAADPIGSIRRRAVAALVGLTGRADLQDGGAWRRWCDSGGCPAASETGDRQGEATGTTATP